MAFTPKIKTPAVFAIAERGPFPNKKSQRCALTGVTIEYGDPVYMVKFEDYNDAERLYVSEEAAQQDEAFLSSVGNLEKRMIPAALMFYSNWDRLELVDPEWLEYLRIFRDREVMRWIMEQPSIEKQQEMLDRYPRLRSMSLDSIRAELDKPEPRRREQPTADAVWDKVRETVQALKNEPDTFRRAKIWKIFGALVMCELHQRLLERYLELMPEFKVMLACSDNHAFVRLAEESGLLPGWSAIHALIGKSRHSLTDMLTLAEWGKANPDALALLWQTQNKRQAIENAYTSALAGEFDFIDGRSGWNFSGASCGSRKPGRHGVRGRCSGVPPRHVIIVSGFASVCVRSIFSSRNENGRRQ